jgi:predicted transcriptional regulator
MERIMGKTYKANTDDIKRVYRLLCIEPKPVGIRYIREITGLHFRRIDDALNLLEVFNITRKVKVGAVYKWIALTKMNAVGQNVKKNAVDFIEQEVSI